MVKKRYKKNFILVKKPDELVKMRGEYSESALKLSIYLITILEEDKYTYRINIKDYLEKFDKKLGNYKYLYSVVKELIDRKFEMYDRFSKKFKIYSFVTDAEYENGILEVEVSRKLLRYLFEIKEKYLKYNIENITLLNSKYAIRVYEILKNELNLNCRYGNKAESKISLDDFREMLCIPNSYRYKDIRCYILEKSKIDLSKYTDIVFEFEPIKTGRKVTHLKFIIRDNPKKIKEQNNESKYFKSRKTFVALLRKNYSGNLKFFGFKMIDGKDYWLGLDKKGLMYAHPLTKGDNIDFNAIEAERIYDIWFRIAKHSSLYQEIVLEGMCLKEVATNYKDIWLDLNNEIKELKEKDII